MATETIRRITLRRTTHSPRSCGARGRKGNPCRRRLADRVPFSVAVSLSTRPEESQMERPPDYGDYRPPRTTAEGGATMLLRGVFLAGAVVTLGLAIYTKLAD